MVQETEMNLDVTRIRLEREKRAWTQEQLAEVAGLGLRTVQRIEATGVASFESAAALSSVLAVPVSELRTEHRQVKDSTSQNKWLRPSALSHFVCLVLALGLAMIVVPPNFAVLVATWLGVYVAFRMGIAVASKRRQL